MSIDTDDLSDRTYNAIMLEAECFHHDLTLQFGLLSYESEDEKDFIKKSENLINTMMKYKETTLMDIFFDNPPGIEVFHQALHKILDNISNLNNDQ